MSGGRHEARQFVGCGRTVLVQFPTCTHGPRTFESDCFRGRGEQGAGPGDRPRARPGRVQRPIPTLALSNTARAGVQGYAKSLADDLGPTGITVNTVLPGYTRTQRLEDLADEIQERTGQSRTEIEAGWADDNALPRIGEPDEFAATVAFLASARAGYVTGVAFPVDGGRSKHLL